MRRILITGGTGQVGMELARLDWPDGLTVDLPGRERLDLCDAAGISAYMDDHKPDCVINCAAWTAVDAAEDAVAAAFLANAQGPAWLAEAAARVGAPIIHLSTDYVFDGALDRPYREDDRPGPLSAYGASKLAGELAVRAANPRSAVLRTAWVLSAHGGNFLKTMLRLAAERSSISVVVDQTGCPTGAADIAQAAQTIALRLMDDREAPTGVYHFVNAGQTSWHGLAAFVFAAAAERGGSAPDLVAIATADYPTRAHRPANSRLDCAKIARDYGMAPRPWQAAVEDIAGELLGPPATGRAKA